MNAEHNVAILKAAYESWNDSHARSFERWMDLIADDVKWRSIADGTSGMEFTRSCDCKDDVAKYFEGLASDWELIHYTVGEFVAQDDRVVMIGSCGWRNKKTGKTVETPKADVIRMRNSRIVEFFEFFDTAKALAASRA